MDDPLHPIVTGFITIMAVAAGVYGLYCTVIAFIGGTIEPFGWELGGSAGMGLVWLFLVTPLITTVAFWITMLIAMPLTAVFRSK